jgi:hypothetical protein
LRLYRDGLGPGAALVAVVWGAVEVMVALMLVLLGGLGGAVVEEEMVLR